MHLASLEKEAEQVPGAGGWGGVGGEAVSRMNPLAGEAFGPETLDEAAMTAQRTRRDRHSRASPQLPRLLSS